MKTRRLALTLFLIVSLLITSPGFGAAFGASGTTASVDVTIAEGGTADVIILMKPANVAAGTAAAVAGGLKAYAAAAQSPVLAAVAAGGGKVLNRFWINNSVLARVDSATLAALAKTPGVQAIIPNFKVYGLPAEKSAHADSAATPATWGLDRLHVTESWTEFSVRGTGTTVAVLDTGIDTSHPALAGRVINLEPGNPLFPGGWMTWMPDGTPGMQYIVDWPAGGDPVFGAPQPVPNAHDFGQHGTHVSGTIAGSTDDAGIAIGIAPETSLMMGAVLPYSSATGNWGYFTQIIAGMQWALLPYRADLATVGMPADIVNMSLGATGRFSQFIDPVRALIAANIMPVISIGNSGPGVTGSPGNIFESWGIGAVNSGGFAAGFSGGGVIDKSSFSGAPGDWGAPASWTKPDLAAPGVDVRSSIPGGGYDNWDGTSMAAPHVSGSAALIIQYMRANGLPVSVPAVFDALAQGAHEMGDPGSPGWDDRYGEGIICLRMSLAAMSGGGGSGTPGLLATPEWPDPIWMAPGEEQSFNLHIQNVGGADLDWTVDKRMPGPLGKPSFTSRTTVASTGASNAKASAGSTTTRASYKVAGPSAGPRVLVYTDDAFMAPGENYVDQALNALGIGYTGFYADDAGFAAALSGDGPWDLVIVSQNNWFAIGDQFPALESYYMAGGRIIVETFDMDAHTAHLWPALGIGWTGDKSSAAPVYRWNSVHPVFNLVDPVPDLTAFDEVYTDNGDGGYVGGDSTEPVGGYTVGPLVGEDAIYVTDRAIVNSFIISEFRGDENGDGVLDAVALWKNEIMTIARAGDPLPWLQLDVTSGSVGPGGSFGIPIRVIRGDMPDGDYFGNVVLNTNDPAHEETSFAVHLSVTPGAPHIRIDAPDGFPIRVSVDRGAVATVEGAFSVNNDGYSDLEFSIGDHFVKGGPGGPDGLSGKSKTLPKPEAGPARKLPGNDIAQAMAPSPPPPPPTDGMAFIGDKLNIALSDFGELGTKNPQVPPGLPIKPYGFEYKDAGTPVGESIAIGWNGEGYVINYDGRTVFSYPDNRNPAIIPMGREILADSPDVIVFRVKTRTDDNRLNINYTIKFNKHSRAVHMSTEFINTGPTFIGELKYKRVVDWDGSGSSWNDTDWHYNPDLSLLSTVDQSSGKYYAYAFGAMGDSWGWVYDRDLNAWDDYLMIDHGGNYQPDHMDGPTDGNVALYFGLGSLAPGERRQVNSVYTVGQGDSAEAAYEDMLTNLGGGAGSDDVPWLSETPDSGAVGPGYAQDIQLTVDAHGLAVGRYFAEIVVKSNDPMSGPWHLPVEVIVNAPTRPIIDDPEDVDGEFKVDIDTVSVQMTRTTMLLDTKFYGGPSEDQWPVVVVTMMDTDENVDTGYTGPGSGNIGSDYMAFSFAIPSFDLSSAAASKIQKADFSRLAKRLPGLNVPKLKAAMVASVKSSARTAGSEGLGDMYVFKWNRDSKTWDQLMLNFAVAVDMDPDGNMHIIQLMFLVTMVDDGSMKIVQSAGDIWDMTDIAPDRGHAGTVPSRNIKLTSVTATTPEGESPDEYLTGQDVVLTAEVGNTGDDSETNLTVNFEVYPVLAELVVTDPDYPLKPGDPGYPNPVIKLDPAIYSDSTLVDVNAGDTAQAQIVWNPTLVMPAALAKAKSKPRVAADDPFIHKYLVKAFVETLPRETDDTDNEATTQVNIAVGTELGVSDLQILDAEMNPVETAFTGLPYTVQVTVRNNGALDVADYDIRFLANGEPYDSTPVTLAPDEETTVTFLWEPSETGSVLVSVGNDPLTGEINPDDNWVEATIDVAGGVDVAIDALTVTKVGGGSSPFNFGNELEINATVRNGGQLPLEDVQVNVKIGAELIDTPTVSLAPGESQVVTVFWTAEKLGAALVASAAIDPLDGEENTANNTRSATFKVNGVDVGISDIKVTKGTPPVVVPSPKKGTAHQVKVTVNNFGTVATTFKVGLWEIRTGAAPKMIGTAQTVTALVAGGNKVLTFPYTPGVLGSATLRAIAGASKTWPAVPNPWTSPPSPIPPVASDIDLANNLSEKALTVVSAFVDPAVKDVKVSGIPMEGKATPVRVTVANLGNEKGSFTVELYAGDTLVKSVAVANLADGASRTVSFSWKPSGLGKTTLTAKIKGSDKSAKADSFVFVPLSLKVTAGSVGPNGEAKVDVQLMDRSGKKVVNLAGVSVRLATPAGVAASAASVTTDAGGHATVYLQPGGKKTVTFTLVIDGVTKSTVTLKF